MNREVLDRLLHLGFYYKELDNFCGRCRNLSWINLKQQPGLSFVQQSVYCRALANGIAEVLAVYRSAVLQVEQTLMADPVPVLAAVTQGLHQVCYTFFLNGALQLLLVGYFVYVPYVNIYLLFEDGCGLDGAFETFSMKLLQFEVLLAPLHALIREVEREQLRGGRLLNLLHAKCHCGIPELQACMQRSVHFIVHALQLPVEFRRFRILE